jgi:Tol biopolymer transport system component
MALSLGSHLGPYEVLALIGAGGMGEVYRARDTRLDRVVAIKIIIGGDAASPGMRERFDREARAIALLSHPNICTLHDIGHHQGMAFLVMEFLEGETLAERLSRQKPRTSAGSKAGPTPAPRTPRPPATGDAGRGPAPRAPLPLDETIRIATQLADALTAAHRAGIVHRDLKPGNIMLTRSGVKVLDFGLAKLKPSTPADVNAPNTMTDLPLTGEGVLLGTIPYMAPEQLEGRTVDSRTDIFAFGAIVYEMAAGRRAFAGESQASLIAAILDREPEAISGEQPLTPPGLERLVRKCLAKDPDDRWQAASDIADELRWLSTGGGSAALPLPPASAGTGRLRAWALGAGVVVLAAVATLAVWRGSQRVTPQAPRREMTSMQATFAGDVSAAALSPDGRTVAYATGEEGRDMRVFVRDLTGGQSLQIWKGADAVQLEWLPNGSQLIVASLADVRSVPALWLVSRFGGTPRLVATPGAYVAVSPDGSQLAHALPGVVGFTLSAMDGTRTTQVRLQGFRWLYGLDWNAPTNRIALLTIDDKDSYTVWSVTPEGNDVRRLYSDAAAISAMCSSPWDGVLYLFRERQGGKQLVKLPLAGVQEPSATVLTSGLQMVSFRDFPICDVSADGERLLYVRESGHANLWRLDLRRPASIATALTRGTSNLDFPSVSPDGQWIVASETSESRRRIVKLPVMGGGFAELTAGGGAAFSPDGTRLAFVRDLQRVWVSEADGRGAQPVKDAQVGPNDHVTWFPDGRLAWQTPDVRNYRIRDLASGHDEMLVKNPEVGWLFEPTFSPQGDQLAVYWNRIDGPQRRQGLWILSWPAREARFIATNLVPVGWSADSQWIYAFEYSMSSIVKVSPRTTKIESVGSFPRGRLYPESCRLTPDRQAIVCSLNESVADAWILEHFDPDVHGERR